MVPEGWKSVAVSDICRLKNGHGFKPSEWDTEGLPIIRIQNLNGGTQYNYFSGEPEEEWLVRDGQMLFAWAGTRGVSFGPSIWSGETGVLNQHIFKVFPRDSIDERWLYYCLRRVTSRIEGKAHGFKSTLVHVKKSEIDNQVVELPPQVEQKRIGTILYTWDRAIEIVQRLTAISERERRALAQQLFSRKKRLPGYEGEWRHSRIDQIATRVTRQNDGGTYPILTISSTSGFVPQEEKYGRFMAGKSVEKYILLNRGEFAYNKGNSKTYPFGCVFDLADYELALVPHVYVCFCINPGMNPIFFRHLFATDYLRSQLGRLVNTGVRNNGLLNITPKAFLATTVPIPPADEQEAIAEVIDTAFQQAALLRQNLNELRKERDALMQQLLTGKRRVPINVTRAEVACA